MPSCAPALAPPPFVTCLEMGAGDTASHLLEEGLLDLHKLGGLDDIKDLFHLPQEHHLGRGQGGSSHSPQVHTLMPSGRWALPITVRVVRALHTSFWVQVLGQYLRSPRITYRRGKESDRKSEGPTFPPRHSHAPSRLHPSPGTAPHSMPAAGPGWKEAAKVRKGQEPRTSCRGQRARLLLITAFTLLFTEHLLLLWPYKTPSSACWRGTGLECEVSVETQE